MKKKKKIMLIISAAIIGVAAIGFLVFYLVFIMTDESHAYNRHIESCIDDGIICYDNGYKAYNKDKNIEKHITDNNAVSHGGNEMADSKPGYSVFFGSWEQDENVSNGPEPIEWIVVDKDQDGNLLLLSKNVLHKGTERADELTWENSNARKWMNEDFYENAFSSEEKGWIINADEWGTVSVDGFIDSFYSNGITDSELNEVLTSFEVNYGLKKEEMLTNLKNRNNYLVYYGGIRDDKRFLHSGEYKWCDLSSDDEEKTVDYVFSLSLEHLGYFTGDMYRSGVLGDSIGKDGKEIGEWTSKLFNEDNWSLINVGKSNYFGSSEEKGFVTVLTLPYSKGIIPWPAYNYSPAYEEDYFLTVVKKSKEVDFLSGTHQIDPEELFVSRDTYLRPAMWVRTKDYPWVWFYNEKNKDGVVIMYVSELP